MRQDLIKGITRLSFGNLFLAGICEVGTEVKERLEINTVQAQHKLQEAFNKARNTYLAISSKANSVHRTKPNFKTWNCDDLKPVLASLKRKDDRLMPKLKADLAATYKMWFTRSPLSLQEYCDINNTVIPEGNETDTGIMSVSEDFEEEGENKNENSAEEVEAQLADALLEFSSLNQSK